MTQKEKWMDRAVAFRLQATDLLRRAEQEHAEGRYDDCQKSMNLAHKLLGEHEQLLDRMDDNIGE